MAAMVIGEEGGFEFPPWPLKGDCLVNKRLLGAGGVAVEGGIRIQVGREGIAVSEGGDGIGTKPIG